MSTTNTSSSEISPKTSERICKHMNEDHAATVYAMAISTLPVMQQSNIDVSNARLTLISLTGVTLKFVACSGDLCAQKQETIPFDPPLTSPREARTRLIAIHHQVLFPRYNWFFSDSLCAKVMVLTSALVVAPILAWNGTMRRMVEENTSLGGSKIFLMETVIFYLSGVYFVAHFAEALYSVYLSQWKLKLGRFSSVCWFFMIFLAGLPITRKLVKLNHLQEEARKNAKIH